MLKGIRYIYHDICESYENHLIRKGSSDKMLMSTLWKGLIFGIFGNFLILKAEDSGYIFFWSSMFCLVIIVWLFRRLFIANARGAREQEIEQNLYRVNENKTRFSSRNSEYPTNLVDFDEFYMREVFSVLTPWQKYISLKQWLTEHLPDWELLEFQASKAAPYYTEYSCFYFYFKRKAHYLEVSVTNNGALMVSSVMFDKMDEDYHLGHYRQVPETYETQQIKEKLIQASTCREAKE